MKVSLLVKVLQGMPQNATVELWSDAEGNAIHGIESIIRYNDTDKVITIKPTHEEIEVI